MSHEEGLPVLRHKKPKTKTRKWYERECDTLFSSIVRSRGACQRCGSKYNLQCAHVIGRSDHFLRWDENNALCLCHDCHNNWAHRFPNSFKDWFSIKFPQQRAYLDQNQGVNKRSLDEIISLYEELKITWSKHEAFAYNSW